MASNNHTSITGNLSADPLLRFTPSGQPTVSFGVAVNRRWQNRQTQDWEESTSFFDVVAWGRLAENISESLTKGTRVQVTGRLEQRTWENQEGERRTKVEIIADDVATSLRYATVAVTKAERDAGGDGPDDEDV